MAADLAVNEALEFHLFAARQWDGFLVRGSSLDHSFCGLDSANNILRVFIQDSGVSGLVL